MKLLFYIFLFSLNFSCNGQEKSEPKKHESSEISSSQEYQQQKYQIEFNNYSMYVNGKRVKLGSVSEFGKVYGKPDYINLGDLIYYKTPINPKANLDNKLDKYGNYLVIVENTELPINDKNGNRIENNYRRFIENNGTDAYKVDEKEFPIGLIHTYRIWMSPYETASIVPDKATIAKTKIPALNGYIKINGKLIHQSITKKELVEKLKPMPKGGQIVGMLGDPVLIYDLGEKAKDFDPNMDPDDPKVFIDIVFKIDPKTKEEKGIYYINYYYNLKDKD